MADRNLSDKRLWGQFMTSEGMALYIPPSNVVSVTSIPRVIDPFQDEVTQRFPLGSKLQWAERTFRYAENGGAAIGAGALAQQIIPLAGELDEALEDGVTVGDTGIQFTQTTGSEIAANAFADGYLNVRDETGEGHLYRIRSHPAMTTSAVAELTLYDPIRVVPADAATGDVMRNPFKAIIIHASPNTSRIVGVASGYPGAFTASRFGWLQTAGPASVLIDQTVVIGEHVRASDAVDGAVEPLNRDGTDENEQEVGVVMAVSASGEYGLIWLTLE